MEEIKVRRILKKYFEDIYNIDTQEQVALHIRGFDGVRRGNYFGREPIRRTEVKVTMADEEDLRAIMGRFVEVCGRRKSESQCR